jgi:hypothetical protein
MIITSSHKTGQGGRSRTCYFAFDRGGCFRIRLAASRVASRSSASCFFFRRSVNFFNRAALPLRGGGGIFMRGHSQEMLTGENAVVISVANTEVALAGLLGVVFAGTGGKRLRVVSREPLRVSHFGNSVQDDGEAIDGDCTQQLETHLASALGTGRERI